MGRSISQALSTPTLSLPSVAEALEAAQRHILSLQRADGHWCGELEGDTIVEAEYILTLHFLGRSQEPRVAKLAEQIRRHALPTGGWAIYPGGPADLSASVKAYLVLKLAGDGASLPHMRRAREVILSLGGVEACNSFTRIYLAIFGECAWSQCPAVPPELVLLPDWYPVSLYRMSSWSRAIFVPLSIIWALKPSCPLPEHARIGELHRSGVPPAPPSKRGAKARAWGAFFLAVDFLLKGLEAARIRPLRKAALRRAEAWILERLEQGDGLGAILPPIINTILALRCLGYETDHPVLDSQVRELERLEVEEEEVLRIQPCFSAVWDTALAMQALVDSGLDPADPVLKRGAQWLVDREVRFEGDWKKRNPAGEPGGWYFEYRNDAYPDTDDTAAVLNILSRVRQTRPVAARVQADALRRGVAWQRSMQNLDGGWGAFDRDCNNEILTFIPFADHNAMIDPSCEDITGRTLEALSRMGWDKADPMVRRGVEFLRSTQKSDGTWYGRWGCNYIYGTWLALTGLALSGEDLSQERYKRAGQWFVERQNSDGGWGELPRSYEDPAQKGVGPSTASQTSWALMALLALGRGESEAARAGVDYLLRTQGEDGSWTDEYWTGTGFPKVFYLKYHLYASYFPLLALGLLEAERSEGALTTLEGDER